MRQTECSLRKTESHIVDVTGREMVIFVIKLEITELIINSTIYVDYQSKMF